MDTTLFRVPDKMKDPLI